MAPQIEVKHNLSEVRLFYEDLGEKLLNDATPRALNKMATTVRAEAAREIGRTYNMKIGAAKGEMTILRATRGHLSAQIRVSGRPIPLIEFDARQTRFGVTVKVKGSRKLIPHAFIAQMGSHEGVYIRRGRGSDRAWRLPIDQLFSISLPVAFTQKQVMDVLLKIATERFAETLRQEIRFVQIRNAR